jgi:hypothetical protein
MIQARRVQPHNDLIGPGDGVRIVRRHLEHVRPAVPWQDDGLQRTTCATPANGAVLDKGRRQRTL